MNWKLNAIFAVSLVLAGCANREMTTPISAPEPMAAMDGAEVSLAEAAVSVSRSLQQLNRIELATVPAGKRLVDPSRYSIAGTVSIDWSGPVAPLLKNLAKTQGYRLRVLGTEPSIPAVVSITATETAIADVLRDIDFQVGKAARLSVIPKEKVIELRYLHA